MLFSRKRVAIRSHFFRTAKVGLYKVSLIWCGKWGAIRSDNSQINPKMGGYKVSPPV